MRHSTFFVPWCVFYTHSTRWFRQATCRGLKATRDQGQFSHRASFLLLKENQLMAFNFCFMCLSVF